MNRGMITGNALACVPVHAFARPALGFLATCHIILVYARTCLKATLVAIRPRDPLARPGIPSSLRTHFFVQAVKRLVLRRDGSTIAISSPHSELHRWDRPQKAKQDPECAKGCAQEMEDCLLPSAQRYTTECSRGVVIGSLIFVATHNLAQEHELHATRVPRTSPVDSTPYKFSAQLIYQSI